MIDKVDVLLCIKCRRIILPCEHHDYKHEKQDNVSYDDYRIILGSIPYRFNDEKRMEKRR